MSVHNAAPVRRRVTVVGALKKSLRCATASAERRLAPAQPFSSSYSPARSSTSRSASSQHGLSGSNTSDGDQTTAVNTPTTPTPAQQQRQRREIHPAPRLEALPTENFYERFPRAVGPLANVVIASEEEHQIFCLTARSIELVSRPEERNAAADRLTREDVARGGFFV